MNSSEQPVTDDTGRSGGSNRTLVRVGAAIALALVAGFVAWVVISRSGSDSATTGPTGVNVPVGPVTVSQDALSELVASAGHPVYWAGPIARRTTEYTWTSAGRAYVRYLPSGVEAGDKRSSFLIIATYPFPDAYRALKKLAHGKGVKIPGGGIAVVSKGYPQSVHFAFPGIAYQGEVYDPSPEKSLKVATSGTVRPVP